MKVESFTGQLYLIHLYPHVINKEVLLWGQDLKEKFEDTIEDNQKP